MRALWVLVCVIILACVTSWSSMAQEDDERWVYVGSNQIGNKWYVDKATISRSGDTAKAWVKIIHTQKRWGFGGEHEYKAGESELVRFTLWEEVRQFWWPVYAASGAELSTPPRDIPPGSMIEAVYQYVFKHT